MKKLLTLLVFICAQQLHAQTYIPMPIEDGMIWRTLVQFSTKTYYNDELINGDTIISGLVYKKVRRYSTEWGGVESNYIIRNDSANKRVYLRLGSVDTLLFDFNLNVGDTLHNYHLALNKFGGLDTITVGTIDSVLINGVYHKRYISVLIQDSPDFNYYMIEGIGTSMGFITYCKQFECETSLVCIGKNSMMSIYPDSSFSCSPLSIREFDYKNLINIYPNPSYDYFEISSQFADLDIVLINMLGRVVLKKSNVINNQPIDIRSLNSGVFTIQFYSNGELLTTKKIMKE